MVAFYLIFLREVLILVLALVNPSLTYVTSRMFGLFLIVYLIVCRGRPQKRFDSRTGKTYYTLQFISRNAYAFWVFYEAWYPNGYKVIPDSIFED